MTHWEMISIGNEQVKVEIYKISSLERDKLGDIRKRESYFKS